MPSAPPSPSSSSSSSASPRMPPPDAWYGHEDTSRTAANYITALFKCPNLSAPLPASAQQPHTARVPLANFVAYSLHRTKLPPQVTTAALVILTRLKRRYPSARGSSGHRLFLSAFMMASKVICDDTYSNASWKIVGQHLFPLKELNQMEREMCGYLEWDVNVDGPEIVELDALLQREYSPKALALAASPSAPPVAPFTFTVPSSPLPAAAAAAAAAASAAPAPATAAPAPSLAQAQAAYPSPPSSPYALPSSGAQPIPSPSISTAHAIPHVVVNMHSTPSPLASSFHSGLSASPAASDGACTTPPPLAGALVGSVAIHRDEDGAGAGAVGAGEMAAPYSFAPAAGGKETRSPQLRVASVRS